MGLARTLALTGLLRRAGGGSGAAQDVDEAVQAAEVPVSGRAIHRTDFVAEVLPHRPGGGVEALDAAIERKINHAPAALLVNESVDIGQIGAPVTRGYHRDAEDFVARRGALGGDSVKKVLRWLGEIWPAGQVHEFVRWRASLLLHFGEDQFLREAGVANEHGLVAHGGHEPDFRYSPDNSGQNLGSPRFSGDVSH